MATHRRGTRPTQWQVRDLLRREGKRGLAAPAARAGFAVGGMLLCGTAVAVALTTADDPLTGGGPTAAPGRTPTAAPTTPHSPLPPGVVPTDALRPVPDAPPAGAAPVPTPWAAPAPGPAPGPAPAPRRPAGSATSRAAVPPDPPAPPPRPRPVAAAAPSPSAPDPATPRQVVAAPPQQRTSPDPVGDPDRERTRLSGETVRQVTVTCSGGGRLEPAMAMLASRLRDRTGVDRTALLSALDDLGCGDGAAADAGDERDDSGSDDDEDDDEDDDDEDDDEQDDDEQDDDEQDEQHDEQHDDEDDCPSS